MIIKQQMIKAKSKFYNIQVVFKKSAGISLKVIKKNVNLTKKVKFLRLSEKIRCLHNFNHLNRFGH